MATSLDAERITRYLLSLPERTLRSGSAIAGGLLREIGDVTLPSGVRRTRLYQALVEGSLRFLIEQVGEVEGAYPGETKLAQDFLIRRTAGNGIEWIGLMTFHASPVWVMAALADISGSGKQLIRDIASSLQKEGLLDANTQFETVEQVLDGLESAAARLAEAFNTPPLDVGGLRAEWAAIQKQLRDVPPRNLPSIAVVTSAWEQLKRESEKQQRSVFELSSMMALSAIANLPRNVLWLSLCAAHAAKRTGEFFAGALLDHYTKALIEIHEKGYLRYWAAQMRPYLRAAALQFSPGKVTTTERLLSP
jgi:hypothetical protein